jgi:hypothetical protein
LWLRLRRRSGVNRNSAEIKVMTGRSESGAVGSAPFHTLLLRSPDRKVRHCYSSRWGGLSGNRLCRETWHESPFQAGGEASPLLALPRFADLAGKVRDLIDAATRLEAYHSGRYVAMANTSRIAKCDWSCDRITLGGRSEHRNGPVLAQGTDPLGQGDPTHRGLLLGLRTASRRNRSSPVRSCHWKHIYAIHQGNRYSRSWRSAWRDSPNFARPNIL